MSDDIINYYYKQETQGLSTDFSQNESYLQQKNTLATNNEENDTGVVRVRKLILYKTGIKEEK